MYETSSIYRKKIRENCREFKTRIRIFHSDGELLLSDADLVEGSLSYSEASLGGEDFTIGGTVASNVSFSIFKKPEYEEIKFIGARVYVDVGLLTVKAEDKWEFVPLGVFNIDVADRLELSIDIKAIDNMINFNRPYSKSSLSYPATLWQILKEACNSCGVSLKSSDFTNYPYVVREPPSGDYTYRDIVGAVAMLAGSFAICDRSGLLELRWYEDSGLLISPEDRVSFVHDDDVVSIKGIVAHTKSKTYLIGDEEMAIDISNNPLFRYSPYDDPSITYDASDYGCGQLLRVIFNKVKKVQFTPFTAEWYGDPSIQAGDIIKLEDKKGKIYNSLVTHSVFKYRGRATLEGKGLPDISKGYKGSTSRIVAEVKRHSDDYVDMQVTALEQAQIQATEFIANMLGGHVIVNKDAMYVADNEDLNKAVRVWKWGAGGFGYSENGVKGPYYTGITAGGSIVAMLVAAHIITADMVETGILSSEDGSTWINLNDGSFNLKGQIKWDAKNKVVAFGDGMRLSWGMLPNKMNSEEAKKKGLLPTTYVDQNNVWTGLINADSIVAGVLSSEDKKTWINLNDGSFSFAGGALSYKKDENGEWNMSFGAMDQLDQLDQLETTFNRRLSSLSYDLEEMGEDIRKNIRLDDGYGGRIEERGILGSRDSTVSICRDGIRVQHKVEFPSFDIDPEEMLHPGQMSSSRFYAYDEETNYKTIFTELKSTGLMRKWPGGPAYYVDDIWVEDFDVQWSVSVNEPPTQVIELPISFTGRYVDIYLCMKNNFYKIANISNSPGFIDKFSIPFAIVSKLEVKALNTVDLVSRFDSYYDEWEFPRNGMGDHFLDSRWMPSVEVAAFNYHSYDGDIDYVDEDAFFTPGKRPGYEGGVYTPMSFTIIAVGDQLIENEYHYMMKPVDIYDSEAGKDIRTYKRIRIPMEEFWDAFFEARMEDPWY